MPTTMPLTMPDVPFVLDASDPIRLACTGLSIGLGLAFVGLMIGFWWGAFGRSLKVAAE